MLHLSATDQQGHWENVFPEVYMGNLFQLFISANAEIRRQNLVKNVLNRLG